MKRDWLAPAAFGLGTFCILLGALTTLNLIQLGNSPTALYMVGLGLFMLGAARLRSPGRWRK